MFVSEAPAKLDATVEKLNVPLPFVCRTCPFVPSEVGKEYASLTVNEAGFKTVDYAKLAVHLILAKQE